MSMFQNSLHAHSYFVTHTDAAAAVLLTFKGAPYGNLELPEPELQALVKIENGDKVIEINIII